jgi:hypothetical protein
VLVGAAANGLLPSTALALETRSYVVSWFHTATYAYDGDCPHGLNPEHQELWTKALRELGYSPADIQRLLNGEKVNGKGVQSIVGHRGRIKGKEDIAFYPWSAPDPHIHVVEGRYAPGFNLDGRGADSPNSFEDPETHERGVNNQLYRALGCSHEYRVSLPDRPQYEANGWFVMSTTMPAWVLSITGEDLSHDGDVTVTFARALEHSMLNARGTVLEDATYRLDPNPRSINVFHGKLKHGTLSIEPADLFLESEPLIIDKLLLLGAHLRLTMQPDRTLTGYIGGYTPWFDSFWILSSDGFDAEQNGVDIPGLWYALNRLADGPKDPKTGKSPYISATFRLELVPAIVIDPRNALAKERPRVNSLLQKTRNIE